MTLAETSPAPLVRPSTLIRRQALLGELVEHMKQNLSDPEYVLADACEAVFTSRRQAQRVLDGAGLSFRAELARLRILEAARILDHSPELPVRTVALRVGYRQPAQFAKAFRRHVGCTPSAFRERRAALRLAA